MVWIDVLYIIQMTMSHAVFYKFNTKSIEDLFTYFKNSMKSYLESRGS